MQITTNAIFNDLLMRGYYAKLPANITLRAGLIASYPTLSQVKGAWKNAVGTS